MLTFAALQRKRLRRRVRVAEGARLESVYTCKRIGGSNPPVSARVVNENVRKCVNLWFTHFFYPNPSKGNFTLRSLRGTKQSEKIAAKVYDLIGRIVNPEPLNFSNKEATLMLNISSCSYILELKDEVGNVQREGIVIE